MYGTVRYSAVLYIVVWCWGRVSRRGWRSGQTQGMVERKGKGKKEKKRVVGRITHTHASSGAAQAQTQTRRAGTPLTHSLTHLRRSVRASWRGASHLRRDTETGSALAELSCADRA